MALVDVDQVVVAVVNLVHESEVVVVSDVTGFDVDTVEPFVMSDLITPGLLDDRVIPFALDVFVLVSMVLVDLFPVLVVVASGFDDDNFVGHLLIKISL